MTTALGIQPVDGKGVSPLTHRHIIASHWLNTGVITGLAVTGRNDLSYNVARGVATCSRGTSDGMTEAYWEGGATPTVPAGDASNPRVDTIWIRANDPTQGDKDNQVTVGVTVGTASVNPVAPNPPTGCTPIARMRLNAGATNTSGATVGSGVPYAVPFGSGGGKLAYGRVTETYVVNEDKAWHEQVRLSFNLSSPRIVNIRWRAVSTVGRPSQNDDSANKRMGSYYLQLRVDGVIINDLPAAADGMTAADGNADEVDVNRYNAARTVEYERSLAAGSHVVSAWVFGNSDYLTYPVTLYTRILSVTDLGVSG